MIASLACFAAETAAARDGEPTAPVDAAAVKAGTEGNSDTANGGTGDSGRVVELNERGSALYAEGDYRRAVELFLQAYAIASDPNLLFNIAACYEGLDDRDAALEKYRAFLADPNADPEGRPRAEGAIARLLATDGLPPSEVEAPVASAASPSASAAAAVLPAAGQETGAPSATLPEWVPWAVLGGGAALGVAGLSVYLWGVADHREVTRAPGYDDPNAVVSSSREDAQALVDSGDTKKVIGASTAALGGAVMVGYVLWRVLERPDEQAASTIDVALSPSAASLSWRGQF